MESESRGGVRCCSNGVESNEREITARSDQTKSQGGATCKVINRNSEWRYWSEPRCEATYRNFGLDNTTGLHSESLVGIAKWSHWSKPRSGVIGQSHWIEPQTGVTRWIMCKWQLHKKFTLVCQMPRIKSKIFRFSIRLKRGFNYYEVFH